VKQPLCDPNRHRIRLLTGGALGTVGGYNLEQVGSARERFARQRLTAGALPCSRGLGS
jgi:hypothetical protein